MARARLSRRRRKRIRNLVMLSAITAFTLTASTYAWFIGMRTVNVSSFDVEIATTDSLLLSLDGDFWSTTVNISGDTLDDVQYAGHSSVWGDLFPVSSIGEMDETSSNMVLFEKASLTASPGGYRLMASQIDNSATEQDGYVVFDLFVKNFSGTQYLTALNTADEEAIYLTTDSAVTVAADGVANTGIENSVRVAFNQVGRVIATETTPATITGITCTTAGSVTGICRDAQIWEPNDTDHVTAAISWYDTSCLERTGDDVTLAASYTANSCGTVTNGTAYSTYAVGQAIASTDNVDVYDGADYNTYWPATPILTDHDYFTDTEKDLAGTSRPTFMTLAPNSITKVRIYIYIEGQDVDNYDFASIGKKISVNFGFTKERFTETDIAYDGPDVTKPVITLVGDAIETYAVDGTYVEAGATALDDVDGNITGDIVTDATDINMAVAGTYYVTYNVVDTNGNIADEVTRTVIVE